MSQKKVFVQRISYRAKSTTSNTSHTQNSQSILNSSSCIIDLSIANSKSQLASSWVLPSDKENRQGNFYRCSRIGDLKYSKFLCPESQEKQCPEALNNRNNLDQLLVGKKMYKSFVYDETENSYKEHHIYRFQEPTPKIQSLANQLQEGKQKAVLKCLPSQHGENTHQFQLSKGFIGSKSQSKISGSQIMKQAETCNFYRSIVYQSQSYDQSKQGFLIDSSSGKAIIDRVSSYLKNHYKAPSDPFFSLATKLRVEDQLYETIFSLKVQDSNILYSWNCKKDYPKVNYFQRKFEFLNHFRIDVFQHQLQLANKFFVEPFLHCKTGRDQVFGFQLRTIVPLEQIWRTQTNKYELASTSFKDESKGQMSWKETHA